MKGKHQKSNDIGNTINLRHVILLRMMAHYMELHQVYLLFKAIKFNYNLVRNYCNKITFNAT